MLSFRSIYFGFWHKVNIVTTVTYICLITMFVKATFEKHAYSFFLLIKVPL